MGWLRVRVLVTGASGFIGRHLTILLSGLGHEVVAHFHERPPQLPPGLDCELFKASLEELEALPDSIEAIVHTAARSPVKGYSDHDMIVSNVIGMDRLLRCAERVSVRSVVFLSSVSVFGEIKVDVVSEAVPPISPDVYGTSKYLGERMLSSVAAKIPSVSLRLPGVLGRGAILHWLARTVETLQADMPLTIANPDAAFNNAVHVQDLTNLVNRMITSDLAESSVVTLGAAGLLTIGDVARVLKEALKSRSTIEVAATKRRAFTIDSSSAISRFGYEPMNIGAMLRLYAEEASS